MTLEEDETAVEVAREDVDTGVGRMGQDAIAARQQILLAYLVEARMRDPDRRRQIAGQPVDMRLGAFIDAGAFLRQPLPLDAVEVFHRGVRSEARPDGRARVGLG